MFCWSDITISLNCYFLSPSHHLLQFSNPAPTPLATHPLLLPSSLNLIHSLLHASYTLLHWTYFKSTYKLYTQQQSWQKEIHQEFRTFWHWGNVLMLKTAFKSSNLNFVFIKNLQQFNWDKICESLWEWKRMNWKQIWQDILRQQSVNLCRHLIMPTMHCNFDDKVIDKFCFKNQSKM